MGHNGIVLSIGQVILYPAIACDPTDGLDSSVYPAYSTSHVCSSWFQRAML